MKRKTSFLISTCILATFCIKAQVFQVKLNSNLGSLKKNKTDLEAENQYTDNEIQRTIDLKKYPNYENDKKKMFEIYTLYCGLNHNKCGELSLDPQKLENQLNTYYENVKKIEQIDSIYSNLWRLQKPQSYLESKKGLNEFIKQCNLIGTENSINNYFSKITQHSILYKDTIERFNEKKFDEKIKNELYNVDRCLLIMAFLKGKDDDTYQNIKQKANVLLDEHKKIKTELIYANASKIESPKDVYISPDKIELKDKIKKSYLKEYTKAEIIEVYIFNENWYHKSGSECVGKSLVNFDYSEINAYIIVKSTEFPLMGYIYWITELIFYLKI